jgi:MoaA/NifB/PqqE/SkfB family radical SAM enzyme
VHSIKRHGLDIELTNRCNAYCNFCPRDKTPQQGFMARDVFEQAARRAKEENLVVMLAGQGESTIHPDFEACIDYLAKQQITFGLTTNASLLTEERSRFLLDRNIMRMTFSAGDLGDDYEEVYGLDFQNTLKNIRYFTMLNRDSYGGVCDIWISLVEHEINYHKRDEIKQFWLDQGVNGVFSYRQISRGGACDNGYFFLQSDRFVDEALATMENQGVSTLCNLAFTAPFVGWNGQYYVCCSDYEKKVPLGSVFDYSIQEMDVIKLRSMEQGNEACLLCNYDPLNSIRENFFEQEAGIIDERTFRQRLKIIKKDQDSQPDLYGSHGLVQYWNKIRTVSIG